MPKLNAYLSLPGKCREAMTFYQSCLGGELLFMPVEGTPAAEHMPPEMAQSILHSSLTTGELVLMATDMSNGPSGSAFSLCLNCDNPEQAKQLFDAISAGGDVTMGLHEPFWGGLFGHFNDRYGVNWMLIYSPAPNA